MSERAIPFLETARARYGSYARHILGFRHFSATQDGLKPVQRRAVWAAHELGATTRQRMVKTARVVGHAHGLYHPHAEGSIAGALANLSQESSLTPLVVGVGSWGSHDSPPAATRYTACYLSPYALTMLDPDELACVPMDRSYDGTHLEPRFLPARLPHLLVSGCASLAAGYNGNIPPCTVDWTLGALRATIAGTRVPRPTAFAQRWGGRLVGLEGDWVKTGQATGEYLPRARVEGTSLVFTSLAPTLWLDSLEARLEKFPGFAGIAEEAATGTDPVRFVARVKRGVAMADFVEHVRRRCRTRERYSFLHILQRAEPSGDVTYDPIVEGPAAFLRRWVEWRTTVVVAAARRRAAGLRLEARRLELLERAVDLRREILKILDQASTRADINARTARLLRCTADEATTVMALSWTRLARLEKTELRASRDVALKSASVEDGVAEKPAPRLTKNAEDAAMAARDTPATERAARKVRKRKT